MLDKEKETYQYFSLHVCLSDVPVEVDGNSYVFLTGGGCVRGRRAGGDREAKRWTGLVSFILSYLVSFRLWITYPYMIIIVDIVFLTPWESFSSAREAPGGL